MKMVKLKDKTILVTGTSKGLGSVITDNLLKNGYSVIGISRSNNNQFESQTNFKHLKFDLSNSSELEVFLKSEIGSVKIDGFVNNAAIAYDDIITNMNLKNLEFMFNVNVFSPLIITKYCLRNMLLHKTKGSIVHISSISVHTGYNGLSMYASSKGALEAFSKNTSREWGQKGIRSNCIVAGFMETEMSRTLSNDQKNRIYKRTSLKRATETKSVANTIEFLLSNKSDSITGQNINVDSGTI
ncbi:SDR family oxidoreductase [Flavobacteriales bacterium]|nr:SDR family oxidoreductase [Flavobacteriales bacterium]